MDKHMDKQILYKYEEINKWLQDNLHLNEGTVLLTSVDKDRIKQVLEDANLPSDIDIEEFKEWYYNE